MTEEKQKEIAEKLKEIEEKEEVRILYAVESGSRAWGFASPDSDYDVRFVYVRKKEDYLRLEGMRDVIEWQLDDVLDINGWDLKKTLVQFHRSNATLFEWSNSSVVYRTTRDWEQIYETAKSYFSPKAAAYHYYGTAKSTFEKYLQEQQVKYKKYLYALRPLLACQYIEAHHCPPPVLFEELVKAAEIPKDLADGIEELLEKKKVSDEQDRNPQIPVIRRFIEEELQRQKECIASMPDEQREEWCALNQQFWNQLQKSNRPW
ncbi:MAG: nucleotidyltransferase domain-containing protein [bacterium]|nr:nucleotidyltransferase domain-containing protein [bacterium]